MKNLVNIARQIYCENIGINFFYKALVCEQIIGLTSSLFTLCIWFVETFDTLTIELADFIHSQI